MTGGDVTVVVATRNRAGELLRTLRVLRSLPERPPVVVVDNGSTDGTAAAVAKHHPEVTVLRLESNQLCAARNAGVEQASTRYVAFSDDDSWWAPGSLTRAATMLDAHPRLALVAARVLVGPRRQPDPIVAAMRASPLPRRHDLPGPTVLGFLACGVVVRRSAFLLAGGFEPRLLIGGEEGLLAIDLASAGWGLTFADDIVAHHHPSTRRDSARRRQLLTRNALVSAWLRRPFTTAARRTLAAGRDGLHNRSARAGMLQAVRDLPWALRARDPVPRWLEADLRLLETRTNRSGPRNAAS